MQLAVLGSQILRVACQYPLAYVRCKQLQQLETRESPSFCGPGLRSTLRPASILVSYVQAYEDTADDYTTACDMSNCPPLRLLHDLLDSIPTVH